jgi:hypothetical protein
LPTLPRKDTHYTSWVSTFWEVIPGGKYFLRGYPGGNHFLRCNPWGKALFERQTVATFERKSLAIFERQSVAILERHSIAIFERQSVAIFERQSVAIFERHSVAIFERQSLHAGGEGEPKIWTLMNVIALIMLYSAKLEGKGQTQKHLLLNIL